MTGRLYIYGAGAHARKACQGAQASGWTVAAFVDDSPDAESPVPGVPLLRGDALSRPGPDDRMFVAIGSPSARRQVTERLEGRGWRFAVIVHPSATVAPAVALGDGTIVAAGAVVESGVIVGRGAILDIGVLVDHDCRIGDFVHLRPGRVLQPRSELQADERPTGLGDQ